MKPTDDSKVQAWYDKICARRAQGRITDRLFSKFKKQYDDHMQKKGKR